MIKYEPSKLLRRIAPKKKIKRLLTRNISLNKTALAFVDDIEFLNKKDVATVALKVIRGYKERLREETDTKTDLKADPSQLVQRVQNEVVLQVSDGIRDKYRGEFYIWLPSDADEPDPEHQLNYGKKFRIGEGEMPGDRYGCKCGMQILVEEDELEL